MFSFKFPFKSSTFLIITFEDRDRFNRLCYINIKQSIIILVPQVINYRQNMLGITTKVFILFSMTLLSEEFSLMALANNSSWYIAQGVIWQNY